MARKIQIKKSDKFAFGVWCVLNEGADPFGAKTREAPSVFDVIRGLGRRGCYGFEFHDNDIVPIGASARERDRLVRQAKRAMSDGGIKATAGTANLFSHPVFKDGAFTSNDPKIRAYAVQKAMAAIDLLAELGAGLYIFWGGREGAEVDITKDPVEAARRFRDVVNFLAEYVIDQGYKMKFSIEPKPNEPRGDMYLATAGHALAFIETLDHPEMVGVNPEYAHIKMANLNPYHEFAQALEAGKLFDVHLNGQKMVRFDQDLSFGWDNPKEAFFVVKLLADHGYGGTKTFDAHPLRTEAEPWDFVERNLRAYKIFEQKVKQANANRELTQMLDELNSVPGASYDRLIAGYSQQSVKKLKQAKFDPNVLAKKQRLLYERIDQLLTEILLGVA